MTDATLRRLVRRLRWAFSNRVVAVEITATAVGSFPPHGWVVVGGELLRIHRISYPRLVLSVY